MPSHAQTVSPLVLALVAGGFTTFGVVIKIGYDAVASWRADKVAGIERFADERRQVYETFYELVQKQLKRDRALYALLEAHHKEGKTEISDEEKKAVPSTFLGQLIETLEEMRRLARIYSVITSGEAIVRLFVDMSRAAGAALDSPTPNDEITWFVLNRMIEDRMTEFVHGYREDLGLGSPKGAPKRWPIELRKFPWSMSRGQAEALLGAHIPPRSEQPREKESP